MLSYKIFVIFGWVFLGVLLPCNSQSWIQHGPSFESMKAARKSHSTLSRHGRSIPKCDAKFGGICPPPKPPHESWTNVAIKERDDGLFRDVFNLILDKVLFQNERDTRDATMFDFKRPEQILREFNFTLGKNGVPHDVLLGHLEKLVDLSPKVSHPYYIDRHGNGLDPYGLAADWVMTIMSSPILSYVLSPVFTLAEMELAKELMKLIGYEGCSDPDGCTKPSACGDFAVTPYTNGYAIHLALQYKYPKFKTDGHVQMGRPESQIFISAAAGPLVEKHAIFQGVGQNNVIKVKTDEFGRMDLNALRKALDNCRNKKKVPIMLVATAGTPVLGAIDPIDEMAEIARDHKMWLHVDGTCGGALLFSEEKISLLKGIEKSDSVSFGAQCLLAAPIENGIILTSHKNIMFKTFGIKTIIFHTTELNDPSYDLGDRTFHTCRRSETFKFWYMWKIKGKQGLGDHIDTIYDHKHFAVEILKMREGRFKLILDDYDTPLVSFYFIHPSLRNSDCNSKHFIEKTNLVTDLLKNKLLLDGVMQISISKSWMKNIPDFFTMRLTNSAIGVDEILSILDSIEACGEKIFDKSCGKCERKNCPIEPRPFPQYVSAPIKELHLSFFEKLIDMIMESAIFFQDKRGESALKFEPPDELPKYFNFTLGLEGICDEDKMVEILAKTIEYSAHQAHPYWLYQLFVGLDPYAVIAEIVTLSLSSPQITYEDNPVLNLMELETGKAITDRLGWKDPADVVYPYGGSMGNVIPIHLARIRYGEKHDIKHKGYFSQPKIYRIYANRDAHHSFNKGSYFTGLGTENCVNIVPDQYDRMNITTLREQIESDKKCGKLPIYIAISAGHTISGQIDPICAILDLCQEFDIWCHIDGTFGGSYLLSDNKVLQDKILKSFTRADSFTFNPGKMLGHPFVITCLSIKEQGLVSKAFSTSNKLNYYQSKSLYDKSKWDNGDQYLESWRSAKVLKVWLMWKAKGTCGITKHLDYVYELSRYAIQEMKQIDGFELFLEDFDLTNVLFVYVPEKLANLKRNTEEFRKAIERVSFGIQGKLVQDGIMVVVAQRVHKLTPFYLKFVLMTSGVSKSDVSYLINQVVRYGNEIEC